MVGAAFVALVVSAAAMLTVPVAVRRMIDVGFAGHDGGFIDLYFFTLIGIGLVLALASAGRMYAVNWLGERVVADMRAQVFRHLATLGPAFYETTHSGEVMSRLTADTTQIKGAAGSALSQALRNTIMLFGALAMMFVTSPMLAAMALAAIPVIVFPLLAYGRAVRRLSRAAQDRLGGCLGLRGGEPGRRSHHDGVRPGGDGVAAFRGGRRAGVRCGAHAPDGARGADRDRHRARRHEHRRRPVVRLAAGDRRRDHRRAARAVRALRGVRGGRHRRAVGGVGRAGAGGRRRRSADGAAGGAARDPGARAALAIAGAAAGSDRLPQRAFRVSLAARSFGAQRGELRGGAGRDGGHRRPVGGGQEHDLQSDPALLRCAVGRRRRRRHCGRRCRPGGAQGAHRAGAAGRGPVRRDGGREHPLRPPRGQRRRRGARGGGGPGGGLHRGAPAGLCNTARGARDQPVGRPAPAHRARPRHPARRADPAARRGDQRARCRERAGGAGGPAARSRRTAPRW